MSRGEGFEAKTITEHQGRFVALVGVNVDPAAVCSVESLQGLCHEASSYSFGPEPGEDVELKDLAVSLDFGIKPGTFLEDPEVEEGH